ncbi:MAG: coproporphyrinogen III oxidase [Deltaproteobacteria bacterium]|nr:coproporphyrinogen III oxidase [Deltaproteobacteria bacterium]
MERKAAKSPLAKRAVDLVESLQKRLADGLDAVSRDFGDGRKLEHIEWFRDGGRHGGGHRYAAADTLTFNRVAVNVSSVHYDDMPNRRLACANALSSIIHPQHPLAPSYHTHISWTEMRDGSGYWRLMADLNPSIEHEDDTRTFETGLEKAAGEYFRTGRDQGDAYFYIPSRGRHRGVCHFYLEGHNSGNFDRDEAFARSFGESTIDTYLGILRGALGRVEKPPTAEEQAQQLAYHSLYLLQVLTLDRGTTSGLLVHDQNDIGILGSLPAYANRELLASWVGDQPLPQDQLLQAIVDSLPEAEPSPVTDQVRRFLCKVIRGHYQAHPEALDLQASGGILPPTVDNHLAES